jgi:hypothetical protein
MVGISAKIGENQNFSYNIENTPNNISKNHNLVNQTYQNNEFLLGVSTFSEKLKYSKDSVDYFIGQSISNENCEFENPYTLYLYTTNDFVIYFDLKNQSYPTEIEISYRGLGALSRTIYPTSPVVFIPRKDNFDYYSTDLYIRKWSKKNRPLIITGIETSFNIKNLISLDFSGQDRSDPKLPCWGLKSNSGHFEFLDNYSFSHNIKSIVKSPIKFYLNTEKGEEQIGEFYVSNVYKENETLKLNIEFKDILLLWEDRGNINIPSNMFNSNISMLEVLEYVMNVASISVIYDENTKQHLSNLIVFHPFAETSSLWSIMNKICEASACYIYCDDKGQINIHYNGGR